MYPPPPPDGVEPVNGAGGVPTQIVWEVAMVLLVIAGIMETCIAAEVSKQVADITSLLYHVITDNVPGA